jgi:hypothetical protein
MPTPDQLMDPHRRDRHPVLMVLDFRRDADLQRHSSSTMLRPERRHHAGDGNPTVETGDPRHRTGSATCG